MGQWSNGDSWESILEPTVTQRLHVCPGSAMVNPRRGSHLLQDSHSVKCGVENVFKWGDPECKWNILS